MQLPEELVLNIYHFLTLPDRNSFKTVSHDFNNIGNGDIRHLEFSKKELRFEELKSLFSKQNRFHQCSTLTLNTLDGVDNRLDELLTHLSPSMPEIRIVELLGTKVTDNGFGHLRSFPQLTTLIIRICDNLTDSGLEQLKVLPNLTSLDIIFCKNITDHGLEHLKGISQLQYLDLSGCKLITDDGVENLKELKQLTYLDLSFCKEITNRSLEHLKVLVNIHTLRLCFCRLLTNPCFEYLKELTHLQDLWVYFCYSLTLQALEDLKQSFSHLRIFHNLQK